MIMAETKAKCDENGSCLDSLARNPLYVGLIIGILAALVQVLLISAGGPEAYGFCVACHTRDVVNDAVNDVAGTKLAACCDLPECDPAGHDRHRCPDRGVHFSTIL